ncbi:MAG: hypothetical protein KDC33_05545 [Thermoleophilia bacterium]|nr:hypothetical protein [Thermoleophilia bacterium]
MSTLPDLPRRAAPLPSRGPRFGHDDRRLHTSMHVLETEDGSSWDAMMFRPYHEGADHRRVAVIVVHGSVGNYLSGFPRRLAFGLAQEGFSVLSVNTRMANFGAFFGTGLFHKTPLDLDAAMALLRRMGFTRVILAGYSMGATVVTYYQAMHTPPEIVGVATFAHPLSLPGALRARWETFGARPSYFEMTQRAQRSLAAATGEDDGDRIVIVRRATGPTDRPDHAEIWTYRTWWHSRGPDAVNAVSGRWVGTLRVPLAVLQAENDVLVPRTDGTSLERAALMGGCPSVFMRYIPGADHVFSTTSDVVIGAAGRWMRAIVDHELDPARAGGA